MISGGYDGTLQVWDLKSGALLNTLRGHTNLVMDVDVTPDGVSAISCSLDKIVCIWDLASGKWVRLLRGHTEGVWSVVASPTERRVISGGDDRTVRIWELTVGHNYLRRGPPAERALFGSDGQRSIRSIRI